MIPLMEELLHIQKFEKNLKSGYNILRDLRLML